MFDDDVIDSSIDLTMTEVISFKRTPYGSRCTIRGNVLPTQYAGAISRAPAGALCCGADGPPHSKRRAAPR